MEFQLIDQDYSAKTIVFDNGGYFLYVRVVKSAELTSPIVEIKDYKESWSDFVLQDGSVVRGQVYGCGETIEEAMKSKHDKASLLRLDRKIVQHGLLSGYGYDLAKIDRMIGALDALDAAEKQYQATLDELGAIRKEDGNYEDYTSWFEVPGVPGNF